MGQAMFDLLCLTDHVEPHLPRPCRVPVAGPLGEPGERELAGPVDAHKEPELAARRPNPIGYRLNLCRFGLLPMSL